MVLDVLKEHRVTDNWPLGCLKITGNDSDSGVIHPSNDLVCDYKVIDSGCISLSDPVPMVGATFASCNHVMPRGCHHRLKPRPGPIERHG